jgi:hypothetical protein
MISHQSVFRSKDNSNAFVMRVATSVHAGMQNRQYEVVSINCYYKGNIRKTRTVGIAV